MNGTSASWPVVIVSEQPLFGSALRMALRARGHDAFQVPTTDADDVLTVTAGQPRAVVLLDLDVSANDAADRPLPAADLVAELHRRRRAVVVLHDGRDENAVADAVAAGALAVVDKSDSLDLLLAIVTRVAASQPAMTAAERQIWVAMHTHNQLRHQHLQQLIRRLSPRELQVLHLLAQGNRAADVAARSVVSLTTVRTQIRAILTKLDVNSQLGAVALLFESSHTPRSLGPSRAASNELSRTAAEHAETQTPRAEIRMQRGNRP